MAFEANGNGFKSRGKQLWNVGTNHHPSLLIDDDSLLEVQIELKPMIPTYLDKSVVYLSK